MLYLMTCEGYTKVGICRSERHLHQRLKAVQTGNPRNVVIHCVFTQYGAELEKSILNEFRNYRTDGGQEWLALSPRPILEFIARVTDKDWVGEDRSRFQELLRRI